MFSARCEAKHCQTMTGDHPEIRGAWTVINPKNSDHMIYCFTHALEVEQRGWTVEPIETIEQYLSRKAWDAAGIGTN
jgi:hypothetical protein